MYTAAIEDYVKTIYKLHQDGDPVSTMAIAKRMGTSAAAVTKMLKHLDTLKLVEYTPYHGVALSAVGEKVALEVIRHHRLIELYLVQAMGYTWDQVDAEAERLEHVISEQFEEKIDELLGHPTVCPHGDPIPDREGAMDKTRLEKLSDCQPGDVVTIQRVKDSEADVLRALSARAMGINSTVEVLSRDRFDGLLTVRVEGTEYVVGPSLSGSVFISRAENAAAQK